MEGASLMSPAVAGGIFTTSTTWEARLSLEPNSSLHSHDSVLMRALYWNRRQNVAGVFCPKLDVLEDFPGCSVVRIRLPRRRLKFDLWVRKIPWRRKWQPTLIFFPGKSHVRGAWWVIVHGVAKSQVQFSDKTTWSNGIPTASPLPISPPTPCTCSPDEDS